MITYILHTIFIILLITIFWFKIRSNYWNNKNVPYIKNSVPILGNLRDVVLMYSSIAELMQIMYNEQINEPISGIQIFNTPGLLIREPELIKNILIKDFQQFNNRYSRLDSQSDTLGKYNLFFLKDIEWRQIRAKLTPVFTSGKLKQMYSLIKEVGMELNEHITEKSRNSIKKNIVRSEELKELCALYTTDCIATTAFGVKANSIKNPNGEFRRNGREIFHFNLKRMFDFTVMFFLPRLSKLFRVKLFLPAASKFLKSTIKYVMEQRIKSNSTRNDLIDILIEIKNNEKELLGKFNIDDDILIAQAAVFFSAGFETTSSTMSFALYELAKNEVIQNKLRQEIKEIMEKNNGQLTYDMIQQMKYLNLIILETLRMYPPLPFLDRECTSSSGYNLTPYSEFKIPKSMPILIPIYAIHRNKKFFPNPLKFDPERFLLPDKIIPYTYMPFGIGPHNCIGERFGSLQVKIGLIYFLQHHRVKPSTKFSYKMEFNKKALTIQSKEGIFCDIEYDIVSM